MFKGSIIKVLISNIVFLLLIFFLVSNNYERLSEYYQGNNILESNEIAWGLDWENYQSFYGGSEFKFSFTNSRKLSFAVSSPNEEYGQGINIYVNDRLYTLETPNIDEKELSIRVEKGSTHLVRVRHFCSGSYSPCDLSIKYILIDRPGKLLSPPTLPSKTMAILGDSIAVGWGRFNFSYPASDKLGYQLHNAGIFGSTLSQIPNFDWALDRYKKDIIDYQPDLVVVFLGTNDLGHKISLETFEKNYQELIKGIKTGLPNSLIVTLGILPRKDFGKKKVEQYTKIIKAVSESMDVSFIDTYDWLTINDLMDNVHPSLLSQQKLASKFYESISSLVGK